MLKPDKIAAQHTKKDKPEAKKSNNKLEIIFHVSGRNLAGAKVLFLHPINARSFKVEISFRFGFRS